MSSAYCNNNDNNVMLCCACVGVCVVVVVVATGVQSAQSAEQQLMAGRHETCLYVFESQSMKTI